MVSLQAIWHPRKNDTHTFLFIFYEIWNHTNLEPPFNSENISYPGYKIRIAMEIVTSLCAYVDAN